LRIEQILVPYSKPLHFSKNPILQQFSAENHLIKKLETLESSQPDTFKDIIDQTREYFTALADKNLTDETINKAENTGWRSFLTGITGMVVTLPIFVAGFIFNAMPFFIPRNILMKRVKDMAFLSTFIFVVGLFIFPLFYLIEASILLFLTKSWVISVSIFILMPFIGKIAYSLMNFYRNVFHESIFLAGKKSYRNEIKRLMNQRNKLIQLIQGKLEAQQIK